MTAPDVNADVRARFERDYLARYPNADLSMLGKDDFGHYRREQVAQQWRGYRAAHADLSGEVRELVEAASEFHAVVCDGENHGGDAFHLTCPICEEGALLESALAKFHPTHQEKP